MLKKLLLVLVIVAVAALTYAGVTHWKHSRDNAAPDFSGRIDSQAQ